VSEAVPLDTWRTEALERGGGDFLNTPFECPLCGHVATPADFIAAGAKGDRAAVECIGRVIGAKGSLHSKKRPVPQPCDWAAFGLFGTLNGGVEVQWPDGHTSWSFAFAEPQP
jgi:hypothetical protein